MSVNNDLAQSRMIDIDLAKGRAASRNQGMDEAFHQMEMMGLQMLQQLLQGLSQVLGPIISAVMSSG